MKHSTVNRSSHPSRGVFRNLRKGGAERGVLIGLVVCALASPLSVIPWALIALAVTGLVFRAFWRQIDQGLPLAQVAALLACLQWLIGPVWYYWGDYSIESMGMAVSETEYFSVAIPGTSMFCLGLLIFGYTVNQRNLLRRTSSENFHLIGILLNGVALVADVAGRLGPSNLAFAFFLLSQLRYVGVLYLWFSGRTWARWLAGICTLPLFVSSAESAMFHDLLIWCGLLFCFWYAGVPRTPMTKVALILAGAVLVFTIQGVKKPYREKVWEGRDASLTEEVTQFWTGFEDLDQEEIFENTMVRLNQGWIVSRVIYHVPKAEPYARGATIRDALVASLIPRFLYADKAEAGGRTNFMRFTGLPINEATSMNVSLLGEGYANFGKVGSWIFLFVAGSAIAVSIGLCKKYASVRPVFLFWIPLIFYQAIKAETDCTEVFNQITKGGALAFVCFWGVEKVFPSRASRGVRRSAKRAGRRRKRISEDATEVRWEKS